MDMAEVGEVEKLPYDIKHFEWKISDFFTFIEITDYRPLKSPTFSIADTSWNLKLYLNWNYSTYPFIQLFLWNEKRREYLVEYYLGLKKCDGRVEQLLSGIFKEVAKRNEKVDFIMRSELMQRKSELVPGDVLTITCTVKLMTEPTYSSEQTALDISRHSMLLSKL